jgi:hypothetical protein
VSTVSKYALLRATLAAECEQGTQWKRGVGQNGPTQSGRHQATWPVLINTQECTGGQVPVLPLGI